MRPGRTLPASFGRWIVENDLRHSGNIFNILRVVFASSVIFSHAFVLTGNQDPSEEVLPFAISRLAVLLFFSLSGFLVTNSLEKRGVRQFAIARGLRIIPGLWAMLAVTALVAILVFGALPATIMIRDDSFSDYLFGNAFFTGHSYSISNTFVTNPAPGALNGSLWTIPREVQCYIALAIVGALGLLTRRYWLLAFFVIGIVAHLFWPPDFIPELNVLRPLAISFFSGVLLFLFRSKVFLSWPLALLAIGLTSVTYAGPLRELAAQLTAAYAMLVLGILVPNAWKSFSNAMPDYSFGMYIYAFFVQQALIALGIATTPFSNIAATLVLTLPLAALSWHFVEKPAMAFRHRLEPKPPRVVEPAARP